MADLPWQRPNATEATAWETLQHLGLAGSAPPSSGGATTLPFPWASWIDAVQRGLRPPTPPLRRWPDHAPVATVCQHIGALEHTAALRAAGVTDVFWSHARRGETHRDGLRLHPFPLLPVRCLSHPPDGPPALAASRPLLYSFQGYQPPGGPSSALRRWLLALPPRPDARVQGRGEWHFEQEVYREQVHGQRPDQERHRHLAADADTYVATLRQSCFALCPAGAGPNSIRLWEALGFGAIPVILADALALPGPAALWRQATLRVPERQEAVAALPEQLERLRGEPERLAAMQAAGRRLWERYGPPALQDPGNGSASFVADLADFLRDPDRVLRQRALERLAAPTGVAGPPEGPADGDAPDGGPPLEEWALADPADLPLRLRRWRDQAPEGARLLLRLNDKRPAALQERLWGPALRLGASLLAERPCLRWAVSARAPALETLPLEPLPLKSLPPED
ncbi:MAG: exostosin family protein [Synechococcaceae cyanobacterium]|nr:exostosin family protein [Synechococcaceae cyanobacterium]